MMSTLQLPPPPSQQQQLVHRITSCDRHPNHPVTGFCASCLRERLAGLEQNRNSPGKPTSSTKSIFFRPQNSNPNHPSFSVPSSYFPLELRRCKSFSFSSLAPPQASSFELQRKSCDVRGRNTLWSLFHLDDHRQNPALSTGEIEAQCRNLGFPSTTVPVLESRVEEEAEEEEEFHSSSDQIVMEEEITNGDEVGGEGKEQVVRPMKEHIDLDAQAKKPPSKDLKEIAGSFWLAASVFSKKLQKWRRKQKMKKHGGGASGSNRTAASASLSGIRRQKLYSTQSEIAEDAFGRRSCDTDPRFSLDAGRMSFDDPRYSWDEPRASWDGYLIGGRSVFPRLPPMLSVVEDAVPLTATVPRSDGLIPVEEDATTPGGSAQTRDYYSDSSQRRRRSLDRSSFGRKPVIEVENAEAKPVPNAKVTPAVGNEFFHHVNKFEQEYRDVSANSLKDDLCESFGSTYRGNAKDGHQGKKSRSWSKAWSIWGLIHRRSNGREGGNGVERSLSESWPELRREVYKGRMSRSNSSVSSRHSFSGNAGIGTMRRSGVDMNGQTKKKREELVFERNRSTRYSPGHLDNGMLRFYLTPMRSSRHGSSRHKNPHYLTKNATRLY